MRSCANCKGGTRWEDGEGEEKNVKITVVPFFFLLACIAPSCTCQQDVRRVHRCSEGASSSVTSLSLSPVTLTLAVSAQPQILPASLPTTPCIPPPQSYVWRLCCAVCSQVATHGGHKQNYIRQSF